MASLKEYIKHYGNLDFSEASFNDVDSMILTQIVYADFHNIVPSTKNDSILLTDAARLFLKKYDSTKKVPKFLRGFVKFIFGIKD